MRVKMIITRLFLVFLIIILNTTVSIIYSQSNTYSIQISAKKFVTGESAFSALKGVKTFHCRDGYIRYLYGEYGTSDMARSELTTVHKLFPDAFIINFNEFSTKYLSGNTQLTGQNVPTGTSSSNFKDDVSVIYSENTTATNNQPYNPSSYNQSDLETKGILYTIQLTALKYPAYLSDFNPINDIKEYYPPDGVYRYCSGNFSTIEEAEKALVMVKSNGFPNAYITKLNKYLPYELK